MNSDFATAETIDLVLCRACGKEAGPHDRFCRRCGTAHLGSNVRQSSMDESKTLPLEQRFATTVLASVGPYYNVSGLLVGAVVTDVLANAAVYAGNRFTRRLLPALLLLPIWLMILLLSPLNAYASARTLTRGI